MACVTLKRPLDSDPLYSPGSRPSKRRRFGVATSSSSVPPTKEDNSPFSEINSSRLTPEQISNRMRDEIRHLRRIKQLSTGDKESSSPCSSGPSSPSNGTAVGDYTTESSMGSPSQSSKKDAPLFTFRQVGLICERLLREREELLRREYDQVLTNKLAEQYDMFVKFTHDQIQKRFEAASAPSYLS